MAARTELAKRRSRSNASGYVFLGIMILMIAGLLFVQSVSVKKRIASYRVREEQLDRQISEQTERAEEIAEFEKYAQTKAYAEDQAHEKLGLVNEGEILFKLE